MKKYYIGLVLIILLITGIIFANKLKSKEIVAPYYEPQAFVKPEDSKLYDIAYTGLTDKTQEKIPIIMYHYVEYVKDLGDFIRKRLAITPATFESQLATLKKNNYTTYFVRDVPSILNSQIKYSIKSVILTFDDGYEDFYTDVFPLLKKYQIKATVYVICDFVGRRGFLNTEQIEELAASELVEIGAHTMDHYYLKDSPLKTAEKQIADCKNQLEKEYGIEIQTLAYPYGAFSTQTIALVKKNDFTAAVSVISGSVQSANNLFYLSRIRAGQFSGTNMINVLENYSK